MEEKVKYVSIKEIASDCQQSSMRDKALLRNPFIKEMDCSKLVFMMGDESVGSVTTLPLQIVAYGNIYSVCAGSNLSVDSRFRGQGIATKLTMRRLSLSKDKIAIASSKLFLTILTEFSLDILEIVLNGVFRSQALLM